MLLKPTIAIINESSAVAPAQLAAICQAVQLQVSRDFAPAWGIDAELVLMETSEPPSAGAWWLVIGNSAEELIELGYYDLTPEGLPLGKVMVGPPATAGGGSDSVAISREVLSMLADPDISTTTTYQDRNRVMHIAREVCDPCGGSSYVVLPWTEPAYNIDYSEDAWSITCRSCNLGMADRSPNRASSFQAALHDFSASLHAEGRCENKTQPLASWYGQGVANFVYPGWYQDFNFGKRPILDPIMSREQSGLRFDNCARITAPFQILDGGYISVYDIATGGWRDIINIGMDAPQEPTARAQVGSRRERRRTPRVQWRKSKGELQPVDAGVGMREIMGL